MLWNEGYAFGSYQCQYPLPKHKLYAKGYTLVWTWYFQSINTFFFQGIHLLSPTFFFPDLSILVILFLKTLPPFHPCSIFSFLVLHRYNKQTSVTVHCLLAIKRSQSKGEKSFLLQLYILWITHILQMVTKVVSGENNILALERNNFNHRAGHVLIASC